jgi:hypothetical protein
MRWKGRPGFAVLLIGGMDSSHPIHLMFYPASRSPQSSGYLRVFSGHSESAARESSEALVGADAWTLDQNITLCSHTPVLCTGVS